MGYGRGSARNTALIASPAVRRANSCLCLSFPALPPCDESCDRHPASPPEGFPAVPKPRTGDVLLLVGMLKVSSLVCLGHALKAELVMGWRSSSRFGLAGGIGVFVWRISRSRMQTWPGHVLSAEEQGRWWWPFLLGERVPLDWLHQVSQLQEREASHFPGTRKNTKIQLQTTSRVMLRNELAGRAGKCEPVRIPLTPVMGNQHLMKLLPRGNEASLVFP